MDSEQRKFFEEYGSGFSNEAQPITGRIFSGKGTITDSDVNTPN
jgi:hypothetical protein